MSVPLALNEALAHLVCFATGEMPLLATSKCPVHLAVAKVCGWNRCNSAGTKVLKLSAWSLLEEGVSAASHQQMQPGVGDSSGPLQARFLGLLNVPAVTQAPAAIREEAWRAKEVGVDAERLSEAFQENLDG